MIANEILNLQKRISQTSDADKIEALIISFQGKSDTLEQIIERRMQRFILSSKADMVEHGEKRLKRDLKSTTKLIQIKKKYFQKLNFL